MKTLLLTLAIILPAGIAHADRNNPDMDDSLDRAVTLAEAQAMSRPAPKGSTTALAPVAGILTAVCNDGKSYYHVTGEHRGACSGHGGVAAWSDGSPVKSNVRKSSYR